MSERSRSTVQKQIILDTLKSIHTHPSVDDLYTEITKKHPSISKATVYRNLRRLAEKGIIIQIAVANVVARFDGCIDHHHHFICNSCGGIFDVFVDDDFKALSAVIQDKYNYKVNSCTTAFFGTCLDCTAPNL